jgi:peptidoglycan/LPS O-acetylase OafA/YrhL
VTITAGRVRPLPARPARLRQLPGLDGLRAIAVVAVIIYHLNPSWLPGGYLGVDVFFVISGYLITSLLMSELSRTGRLSLPGFWLRRARRLLPALGVLLLGVTVLAAIFARDALGRLQADLPASVFYVMNWHLVFQHDDYLASFGRPPLLQHLWSLSVEEQFYLLWPPAFLLLRRRFSDGKVALAALGGAGLSALLMAVLFRHGDPSAVYFATDTHAEGLLIGCALAAALPPWRMVAGIQPGARRLLERSGLAALAVMVLGLVVLNFDSSFTYRGGLVVVDLATAVVVATVAHPASRVGAALARGPLRWIGMRSYSLYLWHWPIFELTRPNVDIGLPGWADTILRLALTAAAADLSYRFVEQPWRDGRAQVFLRMRLARGARIRLVAISAVPLILVSFLVATAPAPDEPAILAEGSTPAARGLPAPPVPPVSPLPAGWQPAMPGALALRPTPMPQWPPVTFARLPSAAPRVVARVTPSPAAAAAAAAASAATAAAASAASAAAASSAAAVAASEPILAIGDSVLLAADSGLTAQFGTGITVDAQVGRQVAVGLSRLAAYRASGALRHYRTVVIDLGTNGVFSPAQFDEMTQLVAGIPRVVVFDVHAARPWVAASNATITAGVAAHRSQMVLADWNAVAGAPGLLYPDGIHPDPKGSQVFAGLLKAAVSGAP